MIEKETGKVGMKIGRHEKRVKFDIVTTQGYDITLGLPWLTEYNLTIDYSDRSMRFDNCMHDKRRDAKIELEKILLKAMFMHYHRNPDSVVLAMVNLEEIKQQSQGVLQRYHKFWGLFEDKKGKGALPKH